MSERCSSSSRRSRFGSMPTTQLSAKLTTPSARSRIDCSTGVGDDRLEDVQLEMALAAGEGDRDVCCR